MTRLLRFPLPPAPDAPPYDAAAEARARAECAAFHDALMRDLNAALRATTPPEIVMLVDETEGR